MTGIGHHAAEPLRRGERALRLRRRLHRVHVVMIGAGMRRIPGEDLLECRLDLQRARRRPAVVRPELPRIDVHQRFGEQHLHVEIVREPARDLAHRVRVRLQHRAAVGRIERLCAGVPLRERADERLLDRRCVRRVLLGELQRLPGDLGPRLGHDGHVVVGADRQRHAPIARGADRIALGRGGERAGRLVVVERPEQPHALIEVSLRLGRRDRGRPVERAEVLKQLRAARPVREGLRRSGKVVRARSGRSASGRRLGGRRWRGSPATGRQRQGTGGPKRETTHGVRP